MHPREINIRKHDISVRTVSHKSEIPSSLSNTFQATASGTTSFEGNRCCRRSLDDGDVKSSESEQRVCTGDGEWMRAGGLSVKYGGAEVPLNIMSLIFTARARGERAPPVKRKFSRTRATTEVRNF